MPSTQHDLVIRVKTQIAQASPQLVEIAKAAQKLNPTLGDTSFLYESISTGIKKWNKAEREFFKWVSKHGA